MSDSIPTVYNPDFALLQASQEALGYEDLPVSTRTPYLRIPQGNSNKPARNYAGQIAMRDGDDFESWAKEGEEVHVVPLYTTRRITAMFPYKDGPSKDGVKVYTADSTWNVNDQSNPLVRCVTEHRDPRDRELVMYYDDKPYTCKVQEELVVVLLFIDRFKQGLPCLGFLGHRGLSYAPCVDMIARCRSHAKSVPVPGSDPPVTQRVSVPMYWSLFGLKTVSQTTQNGDFFRTNYKFLGMVEPDLMPALQEMSKEVVAQAEAMKARFAELDEEEATKEHAAGEGSSGPSPDDV